MSRLRVLEPRTVESSPDSPPHCPVFSVFSCPQEIAVIGALILAFFVLVGLALYPKETTSQVRGS